MFLPTSGRGLQFVSRSFTTAPGSKIAKIRYRFYTSEVPGGFFGTKFDDYYSVTLSALSSGAAVSETGSMNGLGLVAFTPAGYTDWRELSIELSEAGDTLQVQLSVANVGDINYDSGLIIDYIQEPRLRISAATLEDIDTLPLKYLSSSSHAYFSGNTRINGNITLAGEATDSLTDVVLEVMQGGGLVASAYLADSAQASLIQRFGDDGQVFQTDDQLLFELPSAQAALVDTSVDGSVLLRVRAKSAAGDEVVKEMGSVKIIRRFTGSNRSGLRDEDQGGDDWLQPSMGELINTFPSNTWLDFANMNGGPFPPHVSHDDGMNGDGWFAGYNSRNATTAQTMIDQLNLVGRDIQLVFVTYSRTEEDEFWNAIKDVTLSDGRAAKNVIRPVADHTSHFHWRHR